MPFSEYKFFRVILLFFSRFLKDVLLLKKDAEIFKMLFFKAKFDILINRFSNFAMIIRLQKRFII